MRSKLRLELSIFLLSALCLVHPAVRSQNVTFESVKIAETALNTTWPALESLLPVLLANLEKDLKSGGATETAAKIFTIEMKKAMNKDGVARAYAQTVAAKLNTQEQRDVFTFLTSNAGQKYLALSSQSAGMEFIAPMVKQACAASSAQLGFFDRGSMNRVCQ